MVLRPEKGHRMDDLDIPPYLRVLVIGKPKLGKCLTADSEIVVPETGEYITVEEFVHRKEKSVLALDADNRQIRAPVADYLDDGVCPVWQITTMSGRRVKVTASHPLLTPVGWRRTDELSAGDYIAVPTKIDAAGGERMPQYEADLLALMLAEGACSSSFGFTNTEPELIALFTSAALASGCVRIRQDGISYSGVLSKGRSNPIRELCRRHGIDKLAKDKRFPAVAWRMPPDQLARFVGLVWSCDGSVVSGKYLEFGVASEGLARDMVHALLRFGIVSRLRQRKNAHAGSWSVSIFDAANVEKFRSAIPLFGKKKNLLAAMDTTRKRKPNVGSFSAIRYPEVVAALPKSLTVPMRVGATTASTIRSTGRVRWDALKKLDQPLPRWLTAPDVLWDEIKEVEFAGLEHVYDLTVSELHNFVANDVYVHNTRLMGTAPKPMLVLSCEGGLETLRGEDGIVEYPLEQSPDGWLELEEWIERLRTDPEPLKPWGYRGPVKSVGIDSVSELYNGPLYKYVLRHPRRSKNEDPDLYSERDYGRAMEILLTKFREFRALPMHLILTSEIKEHRDPSGRVLYTAGLAGQLDIKLPHASDWVVYLDVDHKGQPDPNGALKRIAYVGPADGLLSGSRMPARASHLLPRIVEEPTIDKLIGYVDQARAYLKQQAADKAKPA